jgi:cytochrome c553
MKGTTVDNSYEGCRCAVRVTFPRLAGQLHDYIYGKLTNWEKERGQDKANPDTSAIMQPIAHDLTAAQIKAVAAYVSHLE